MSLIDFNLLELRPHFPGYPIFCFFSKIIYFITQSIPLTFSFIGGISIYLTIIYTLKIWNLLFKSRPSYLKIFIFLNPLLWILSNRYMSDILGLSLVIIGLYYFIKFLKFNYESSLIKFLFAITLLMGVRISFLPFFLPAFLYLTFNISFKKALKSILILSFGISTWLLPLIYITGFKDFLNISFKHINGHFFNWGGSIISSNTGYVPRFTSMIESILADGMGTWWTGRHWITILISIFLLILFLSFVQSIYLKISDIRIEHSIMILCLFSYLLWAYFFQNIIYKPRHILPILPFLIMVFCIGVNNITKQNIIIEKVIVLPGILCIGFLTLNLIIQHKEPTALSQIQNHMNDQNKDKIVFSSSILINNFIKHHKLSKKIIFEPKNSKFLEKYYNLGYTIFTTYNLDTRFKMNDKKTFYHNPYVNRLWPILNVYEYKLNTK